MAQPERLWVAIAGAGMVTRYHLKAWSRIPGVEGAAIYNRHLDKALGKAAEFGIPKVYSDIAKMSDQERPDVLDIAVSVEAHSEFARMAAGHTHPLPEADGTISWRRCGPVSHLKPTASTISRPYGWWRMPIGLQLCRAGL